MYRWFLTWNIIVYIVSQVSSLHLLFISMKTVKSYSTRCDPSILLFYNLIHGILHSQYQCLLWSIGWRYCFISNKLQTIEKICGDITIDWCIHIKIIEILMKLLPTIEIVLFNVEWFFFLQHKCSIYSKSRWWW